MSLEKELIIRSGAKCELCKNTENLKEYIVLPTINGGLDESILACSICICQIENKDSENANHWRCLNESIWNESIAVQVVSYRMLFRLREEGWPKELLEMVYFDEHVLVCAKSNEEAEDNKSQVIHKDANGVVLLSGDNVVLIKDLKVKGSSMVAKQGTAVRNIRLDHENDQYIEGKVEGQQIVIITKYVKKT